MSFAATARRVRDSTQPFGRRVSYLHGCLESFSLFGYHATRAKLRAAVGASGPGWTEKQVLDALDLLESAQRSWATFLAEESVRRRELKRRDWGAYRSARFGGVFQAWLEAYLDGGHANEWGVADADDCIECGHRLIHHGPYGCQVCTCKFPFVEIRPD